MSDEEEKDNLEENTSEGENSSENGGESEGGIEIKKAEFEEITPDTPKPSNLDIEFLLDITLNLSIELGRAIMNVREILNLGHGSVVELNKLAGDPVDIYVNGKLIANGEVVVIDDNFGVRVTDILSPAELLNNLKADNGEKKSE